MTFSTILTPLDGSPLAEAALPYAAALARATGARVRLLMVVDDEPMRVITKVGRPELREQLERLQIDPVQRYLDGWAAELSGRGASVITEAIVGLPTEEILARTGESTIVVMATHGRGGAVRWAMGSVADKVMRLSGAPILLVGSPRDGAPPREATLRHVLTPLDGSPLAEAALPLAGELCGALSATLTLARVEPWLAERLMGTPAMSEGPDLIELDARVAEEAHAYLEGVRDRLPKYLHVKVAVPRGAPADALRELVTSEHIDLVVMSTRGHGGLQRFVLGSTADRLVRAGIPTLLVREPAADR